VAAAAAGAAADPAAAPAAAPVLIDVSLGAAALLEVVLASADVIAAAATSTKSVSVSHKAKNDRRVKEFEQILVLLFGVACTLEYLNSLNVPGDATKQQLIGSILTAALSHAHKKSPTLSVTVPKELRAAISALYAAGGRFFGLTSITENAHIKTFVVGARKEQVAAGFANPMQADRFDIQQFLAILCGAFKVITTVSTSACTTRARGASAHP
jgi:hypothetical protein